LLGNYGTTEYGWVRLVAGYLHDVTQHREQQKYQARKYGNSVCMSVETPTPQRNDKWDWCDTKYKTHKFI
jgi:hypothetical protein